MSDTPFVPADPDDRETAADELPVAPDDGKDDRDELSEGIGELLLPDPPETPAAGSDTSPPG